MKPEYKKKLEANIWKIKLNAFLMNFFIYSPILFVAFQAKGFSLVQIALIMSAGSISSLIFEIPTGILADRWGRKHMIALAGIAGIFSMLFWNSSIYLLVVIGMVFRTLLNNSINGSDTALLYDTLVELKREKEYAKHNGSRFSTGMMAFTVAAVFASLIPKIGFYSLHFIITAVTFLVAMLVALSLTETKKHKMRSSSLLHLKEAFNYTRKHRELYKIIIYMVAFAGTLGMIVTYMQFFFKEAGISPQYYGYLYAALGLIAVITSKYAYKIEQKFGERNLLLALPLALITSVLLIVFVRNYYGLFLGLIIKEMLLGLQGAVLNDYLQKHSSAAQRSTIESLKSFYQSCYGMIIYLIASYIGMYFDIFYASLFMIAIMTFLIIPPTYFMYKESSANKN